MSDNIKELSDTLKNLHQSAVELHSDGVNVVDRLTANTMETIPVKHRVAIEAKVSTIRSKLNNVFTSSIRRIELLFENDEKWFAIKCKIKTIVTNEQNGYEFIKGIIKNAASDSNSSVTDYIKKFMMVLLILARVLERLNELDKLSVSTAARLVGKFMSDVFNTIVKPMARDNILNQFLPALDDQLKKDYQSQFLNLGRLLGYTAVLTYAENLAFGSFDTGLTTIFGTGAILGQLWYCYTDVVRKDDEKKRLEMAKT